MSKTIEEICIQNIESGTRAIRLGTKTPKDANVGTFFAKLKPLNEGMHDDLMSKYKRVVDDYNKNNPK